jgi:hypothetical protein
LISHALHQTLSLDPLRSPPARPSQPQEPSRESLEAEALLLGAITGKVRAAPSSGASSLQHSQSFKVGNKTTVVEVDVSGVHDDVLRKQAEGERQRKEAERKRTEMVRIYEQMEERKKVRPRSQVEGRSGGAQLRHYNCIILTPST